MTSTPFDRVRPRHGETQETEPHLGEHLDSEGKAALFSRPEQPTSLGSVTIVCSSCRRSTVRSYAGALRLAVPSLHLPMVHKPYPSWMRCPACAQRTWVRVEFGL